MVEVVVTVVPVLVVVEEAGFDVEDVLLIEVVVELLDGDEVVLVAVDVDIVEEIVRIVVEELVIVVVGEMRVVVVVDEVVAVVV